MSLEELQMYYSRLFPVDLMHRWLSYGYDEDFAHREFSFTLAGDIYIRFQSFNTKEEFLKELIAKKPEKIDIGAVYTQKPKQRDSTGGFQPREKEFVLDIDLTDYDDVRTCCNEAKVCQKCWKFIAVAVEILDSALRNDFGFQDLLWVFSGRRGVHCWVSDESARDLDVSGRAAVVDYLSVVKGSGENQAKKVKLGDRYHPSIRRAVKILERNFDDICKEDQRIFEKTDKHLDVLPIDLKNKAKGVTPSERWETIFTHIQNNKQKIKAFQTLPQELAVQFCYPRLDANVSKGLNHLLKSPFCIHPKTGKVCVPFDPTKVHDFQIDQVPNISQLIEEIGAFDKEYKNQENVKAYKKTSLNKYMEIFANFVKGVEKRETKSKIYRKEADKTEW